MHRRGLVFREMSEDNTTSLKLVHQKANIAKFLCSSSIIEIYVIVVNQN